MSKRKSKVKMFFLSVGALVAAAVTTAAVSTVFIFTMEQASAKPEEAPAVSEVESEPAFSSAQPPKSGAAQANAKPEESPAEDDRIVLVNYAETMPEDFHRNIVNLYGVDVDERIVEPFQQMQAAAQADGVSLWISSGYRSVQRQSELFDRAVEENLGNGMGQQQAEAVAALSVARPGCSEHNTGLAIDLNGVRENFDTTPEYEWLTEHAAEYGFILRYPEDKQEITKIRFEPWHYRYVGVEHAKAMQERHFCLEEYVEYLENQR